MIDRELVGKVFGRYTVISQDDNPFEKRWWCRCECGTLRSIIQRSLTSGQSKSCGCLRNDLSSSRKLHDKVNMVYGQLTVMSHVPSNESSRKNAKWLCRCSCGTETIVDSDKLISGITKSCGCLRRFSTSEKFTTHGLSNSKEYSIWKSMKTRCTNPSRDDYKYYGGRGISVHPRWLNSFESFIADMGTCPSDEHSIERRDVDGDYEPGNCYWATAKEQARNRRNNIYYEYEGSEYILVDLAERAGVLYSSLRARILEGLSVEDAVKQSKRLIDII